MKFSVSGLGSFFFICSLLVLSVRCLKVPKVPALFILGDSEVDVGNNNFLPFSLVKADFPYNGIDFPGNLPTGRFCNGKNAADFVAEKLSLPTPPPYLSSFDNTDVFLTGLNFASGGSGVFNSTGQSYGLVIPLTQQVNYYASVHGELVKRLGSDGAKNHSSKSVFLIVTGSNDILDYSGSSDLQRKSSPQQYVDSMILILKEQIKRLYSYGAQKFVFAGLAPIGCVPSERINSRTEECNKDINLWCAMYNEGLKSMLQQVKLELKDMDYLYFDAYSVFQNILHSPASYGFTEAKAACCGLGKLNAEVPCLPIAKYCSNRSNHVFWDVVHPTETTYHILVDSIFDGRDQYKFPMSMMELIAV